MWIAEFARIHLRDVARAHIALTLTYRAHANILIYAIFCMRASMAIIIKIYVLYWREKKKKKCSAIRLRHIKWNEQTAQRLSRVVEAAAVVVAVAVCATYNGHNTLNWYLVARSMAKKKGGRSVFGFAK